jgi:trk system potassium uptake protein TrkA
MLPDNFKPKFLNQFDIRIVAIERNKRFFIPKGDNIEIIPNDLIYLFGKEDRVKLLCEDMDKTIDIDRCIVYGAGALGVAISKKLINNGCKVKLIERDIELCNKADEELEGKAIIINTKYNSHEVLRDEGLNYVDIFISTTSNDEFNIIKSLEAKEMGIKKVVAINNDLEYYSLMHSLGIIVVRGAKISTYNSIMEDINSTKVVIQKNFCGARGVVYMRRVFNGSKLIDKNLTPINTNSSLLFYIRNEEIFNFTNEIKLQKGDLIVSFCDRNSKRKVGKWLYEL